MTCPTCSKPDGTGCTVQGCIYRFMHANPGGERAKVKGGTSDRQIEATRRYFDALKRISKYMTPDQIRRDRKNIGLGYEEYLEMAYENVLAEAKAATKGKRRP